MYALGAILYEMLTGRPPFRAETAVGDGAASDRPGAGPAVAAERRVPRDLETICLKCLRKEPRRRYASAAALADDLRRFQEGRPIQARPLGRAGHLWRWAGADPAVAALVATALALVGLAVGGGFWLQRQQAEQREEAARQEGRESQAVEALLTQAADLQKQGRWPESARCWRGRRPVGSSALADLRKRVRRAEADADMVAGWRKFDCACWKAGKVMSRTPPGGTAVWRGLPGLRD